MSDHAAAKLCVLADHVRAVENQLGDNGYTSHTTNMGPRYSLIIVDSAERHFDDEVLDPLAEAGARFEALVDGCAEAWSPYFYVAPGDGRAYQCLVLENQMRPIVRLDDDGAISEEDLERGRECLAAHTRFRDQLTVMGEMKEAIGGLSGDVEED